MDFKSRTTVFRPVVTSVQLIPGAGASAGGAGLSLAADVEAAGDDKALLDPHAVVRLAVAAHSARVTARVFMLWSPSCTSLDRGGCSHGVTAWQSCEIA